MVFKTIKDIVGVALKDKKMEYEDKKFIEKEFDILYAETMSTKFLIFAMLLSIYLYVGRGWGIGRALGFCMVLWLVGDITMHKAKTILQHPYAQAIKLKVMGG